MEKLAVVELSLSEMVHIDGGRTFASSVGYGIGCVFGFVSGTVVSFIHGFQEGVQAA